MTTSIRWRLTEIDECISATEENKNNMSLHIYCHIATSKLPNFFWLSNIAFMRAMSATSSSSNFLFLLFRKIINKQNVFYNLLSLMFHARFVDKNKNNKNLKKSTITLYIISILNGWWSRTRHYYNSNISIFSTKIKIK